MINVDFGVNRPLREAKKEKNKLSQNNKFR